MTEMQKRLLEMLKWFHGFCVENNLRYFALGGTLLGAVRHKGFIPWDDDIDVGMPRADYNRLISCMSNKENGTNYILEAPLQNKDFVYQYCKLYDTTTTMVENTRYKTKRGIFLDIFPLDGIGDAAEESKKNYKAIQRKNNYIMTKVCAVRQGREFYKNLAIVISRCIPFPSWRTAAKKLDALCASRDYENSKYVANLYGNWHEREIVLREWMGTPTPLPFENIEIFAPQDYDKYLTNVYGDYMTPPPADKQVSHHDFLSLDLHRSYFD